MNSKPLYSNEQLKQMFIDNQNLVYDYMKKNKKYLFLFDSPEDMAQELFLKMWKSLKDYDNTYSISTYINKILNNCCKDKVRSLNSNGRVIYLKCIPECNLDNGFERIIDKNYNALDDFINKYELNNMSDMAKEYVSGYNYEDITKRHNTYRLKVIREIQKEARRIEKRNGRQ